MKQLKIGKNEEEQRLDRFFKKYLPKASLSYIYKIIRKDVKINGKRQKNDYILKLDDELNLYINDEELKKLTERKKRSSKAKRQFKIAYEDENLIIVEKPFGLLTHGDITEKKNHLVNQVIDYLIETGDYNPRIEKTFVPAPVNRLDRNTTGLVIFGKNSQALRQLNKLIGEKDAIKKYYLTIVCGVMKDSVHLKDSLVKDRRKNVVKVVSESTEEAKVIETIARPVMTSRRYSLVEVEILTGRSHQIRAHLGTINHPIIGDKKYGNSGVNRELSRKFELSTQLLHAYKLTFDGCKGELSYLDGLTVTANPPEEFQKIKNTLFGV